MPSTHMTHSPETNSFNFSDFFLGVFIIISFLLILLIIILLFVFKDQIQEKFSKKINFSESVNPRNSSKKLTENHPEIGNHINNNEATIEGSYELSYSIDDQAYQRERLMNLINNYPEGILQSKLPNLTNLSKATVSRRIGELVESKLILREPRGRSILITPKNA
jgi:hypothetical protein